MFLFHFTGDPHCLQKPEIGPGWWTRLREYTNCNSAINGCLPSSATMRATLSVLLSPPTSPLRSCRYHLHRMLSRSWSSLSFGLLSRGLACLPFNNHGYPHRQERHCHMYKLQRAHVGRSGARNCGLTVVGRGLQPIALATNQLTGEEEHSFECTGGKA